MAEQRESAYPRKPRPAFCFCFRRDADDAERVEERPALRAVLLDEDVVGRPAPLSKGHVAVNPAVAQLVRDGLGAPAHVLGDPPHRPFETRAAPEPLPVFQLHVLHCRLPFFSFDRRRAADTRRNPSSGWA